MKTTFTLLLSALITFTVTYPLFSQIPSHVNYQGLLADEQGKPVNGNRNIAIKLFNVANGGNATYEENIGAVTITNGIYSFAFGTAGNGIRPALTSSDIYLAIFVNGTEQAPRTKILAVPFALKSADAQQLRSELVAVGFLPVEGMVLIQGGALPQSSGLAGQQVSAFQIGKFEVTWGEWQEVRTWALNNGYSDLANVGAGSEENHPVHSVSWYDVVKWMNAKSEKEGLTPVYYVNGVIYKAGQSIANLNVAANGYRLPTEKEWEWAARGGLSSQGYTFSGSNDVNAVAWYQNNSGGGTKALGTKAANELGIYDMSGNVWEWCWDIYDPFPSTRRIRGGSWSHILDYCYIADRYGHITPNERYNFLGFRLARRLGN